MLMLGLRQQGYNVGTRPTRTRELIINNPKGDLDAYVAHWDDWERCGPGAVSATWEAIAERMRTLLPRACSKLTLELGAADVRSRVYCAAALDCVSKDLKTLTAS